MEKEGNFIVGVLKNGSKILTMIITILQQFKIMIFTYPELVKTIMQVMNIASVYDSYFTFQCDEGQIRTCVTIS